MKEDVVKSGVEGVAAGQAQVLVDQMGMVYDQAYAEGKAAEGGGGLSQADVDKAVADQKAIDDQALSDAHAEADAALADVQSKMADLQKQLDDMTAKDVVDAAAAASAADLAKSVAAMQTALDAIKALFPAPQS